MQNFCVEMDYMAPWNDEENPDEGIGGIGGDGDLANLLVKLTDNALSGAMFERRAAARGVLDAFKQSCFAEEDTMNVIAVIEQLVNDQEQLVRQEIMEQLPEVAVFCHEEGPYLDFVVPQHILPHIVKLITDKFSQVRKSAQTGLLSLLEKGIIAPRQVAEQVCPVIMEYTEPNVMDDYRTEVTGFMSKLARHVGKEIVVNWFLERFCSLCQDPMFQVRRVCASSMGDIANVIGTRLTEAVLLPEFLALCKDDVWGVRKGCAEIFTEIARLCQISTRREKLTTAFVKLLEDTTKWVKVAAYQSLGPFITTFGVEADTPVEVPELTEFEKTFIERVRDSPANIGFENKSNLSQHHRSTMLGSESTEDLTSICIQDDDEDDGGEEGKREKEDEHTERNIAIKYSNYDYNKDASTGESNSEERQSSSDNSGEYNPDDKDEDDDDEEEHESNYLLLQEGKQRNNKSDHKNELVPQFSMDEVDDASSESEKNPNQLPSEVESPSLGVRKEGEEVKEVETLPSSQFQEDGQDIGVKEHRRVRRNFKDKFSISRKERYRISNNSSKSLNSDNLFEDTNIQSHTSPSVSPVVSVHTSENEPGVHIRVEKQAPEELTQRCRSSSVLTHRPNSITGGVSHHVGAPPTATDDATVPFNTFQYWRIPLPDIELDIGMVEGKPASVHVRAKVEDPELKVTYASEISVNLSSDAVVVKQPESGGAGDATNTKEDVMRKIEYLQIQAMSSSQICDNEKEQTTKLESSLSNTTVSLVDGRVTEVQKSSMDLYNVTGGSSGQSQSQGECATASDSGAWKDSSVLLTARSGGPTEDFSLDMTHLEAFDDDSDDQLSLVANCGFSFEERKSNLCASLLAHFGGFEGYDEQIKKTRILPELPKSSIVVKQDVVPDELLDHFIQMSQDSDPELAPCCVFNLPAVVLTLGPQHWSVLRDCYENLATSLQWKVRYTLAASLHEIANILGPELSERDLVPFYSALMMDLDEVRVGVLKHLACFFKILGGEERRKCLRTVKAFIKTDNPRNWRFRLELVHQIQQLVDMFQMDDVCRHVCPVCIDLIKDKVAEIRKESLHAVTYVVKRLNECRSALGEGTDYPNVVHEFLLELVKSLSSSTQWVRRQTFAALAGQLIVTNALNPSQFAQDILPHLIALSEDKVPNVRLVVARSIVSCVLQQDYFNDPLNPHRSLVMETLTKLQEDVDQDVRFHSRQQTLDEEEEEQQLLLEQEQIQQQQQIIKDAEMMAIVEK